MLFSNKKSNFQIKKAIFKLRRKSQIKQRIIENYILFILIKNRSKKIIIVKNFIINLRHRKKSKEKNLHNSIRSFNQ